MGIICLSIYFSTGEIDNERNETRLPVVTGTRKPLIVNNIESHKSGPIPSLINFEKLIKLEEKSGKIREAKIRSK